MASSRGQPPSVASQPPAAGYRWQLTGVKSAGVQAPLEICTLKRRLIDRLGSGYEECRLSAAESRPGTSALGPPAGGLACTAAIDAIEANPAALAFHGFHFIFSMSGSFHVFRKSGSSGP